MKVHRLIALTTLSTLCIAASAAVSADPVTFDGSTPASATTTHGRLMNATQIAFPTSPNGPLDELQALLNTMDSLPNLIFPSATGPVNKVVTSGGLRHTIVGFASRDEPVGNLPSIFALDTPASLAEVRAEAANVVAKHPSGSTLHVSSIVSKAPMPLPSVTPDMPDTLTTRDTSVAPILQTSSFTQANPPPPGSLEQLYNQHRLFSDNPAVPFAEYDQSDHCANDLSADAFQNNLFVPDRPFPINQPVYLGNEQDYTTDLEVAGGIAAIALLAASSGHHKPIPETSSLVGLAALCAGGSLALIRTRRRASA